MASLSYRDMSRIIVCIVLCALCAWTTGAPKPSSSVLPGLWRNQLKSVMNVTRVDAARGAFYGTYTSAVGEANGSYLLSGHFYVDPNTGHVVVSWIVSWQNTHAATASIASWAGQLFNEGTEIDSTWLLVHGTAPEERWTSTRVGHDVFHHA
jgi:hypothetical protein